MKNLILITNEFPYSFGEPFIVNELPYLCNVFNEIFIFAIYGNSKSKITRKVPNNVRCFPLNAPKNKIKYPLSITRGLFCTCHDLCINDYSLKKILLSLYMRGKAHKTANDIYDIIKRNRLNVNDTVIYSFWFAYQAIAAWLLSDMLIKHNYKAFSVARAHGYDLYWERNVGNYIPFQDISLKKLKWCFTCSQYGRDYLLKKYPWADQKVITERLGTTDFGFNPYNNEKTLVTCSNLEPIKRVKLFAEAFCDIAIRDKELKWICIGDGRDALAIKNIISTAGVDKQVTMTGRLSYNEVMEIYNKKGIMFFCNVSVTEGLPVSIMEAMSFGIPIIATDVGGTAEIVDSNNGYLIAPFQDKNTLIKCIEQAVYGKDNNYELLRKSARKKWERLVSAEVNYKRFAKQLTM